jgi:hypothetical protein
MPPEDITMNTNWSAGNPGAGVDSAFPEQLVIVNKESTAPSIRHLGLDARITIVQIGMRKPKYS